MVTTNERIIENPVINDRIMFLKTTEDTNGEYLLCRLEVVPGGGNVMHYHTTFTERFEVETGQLNISIDGREYVLRSGESALVPKFVHHRFYNMSNEPVTALIEIRPARHFEKSLRVAYGLARDGKVNSQSLPHNIWHLALLFQLGEGYVAGMPLMFQKALFGGLAYIARILGKDKELKKYY